MKKRILAMLMVTCVALTATVGFTGCGEKEEKESTASGIISMEEIEANLYENIEEYVTLGDYKSIAVDVPEVVVTDEQVQEAIDTELEYYGEPSQIKEGTVADGDTINIDYVGKIGGVAFENGSDEAYDLEIGSNSFIEGFESSLIGKTIGETTIISVTFPEDYQNADVAGQDATFDVTINYKHGDIIPAELNDELVASMGIEEVTTVDQYKAYMRESLETTAADTQKNNDFDAILQELIKVCTVNQFHDDLDEQALYDEEIAYMEQYAESYSYSYDEFVALYTGMEAAEYEAALKEDIALYVQRIMIYRAIAKAEGIEFTEEEYKEEVASYSADYESYGCASVEEFEEQYSTQIYEFMIYDAVETLLYESTTITRTAEATEAPAE